MMKVAAVYLYMLGFGGIALQYLPGIPDTISFSVIVMGLAGANIVQYREASASRKERKEEEEKFRIEIKDMRKENIDLLEKVLTKLSDIR